MVIKKSRAGLALRLISAGSSSEASEGIRDTVHR